MNPTLIELQYNGHHFLIDVAEGNMVSLNKIYEIAGAPETQSPSRWTELPETKRAMEKLGEKLGESMNDRKSAILETDRVAAGVVWAHWQLALSYAQYLSPELHIAVNQVFKERLEEMVDPELGVERSRERARQTWREQGKNDSWIAAREQGIDTRKAYVGTLLEHNVNPGSEVGHCTNQIYIGTFLKGRHEIEQEIRAKTPNLPAKINIRDFVKRSTLQAIGLAEALASEHIEEHNVQGVYDCARISLDKGRSVRMALDDARSKSPKVERQVKFAPEAAKAAFAESRKNLGLPEK